MQSVKSKNGRSDNSLHKNGKSIRPFEKLYRPSDREPFMNERQREYFRMKLLDWREDILKEAKETLQHLQDDNQNHPDLADRASSETDRAIELRARDRQRKLICQDRCGAARASRTAPTATARRPASRSRSSAWKRVPSPPCQSRRRNATSAASGSTARSERGRARPPGPRRHGVLGSSSPGIGERGPVDGGRGSNGASH